LSCIDEIAPHFWLRIALDQAVIASFKNMCINPITSSLLNIFKDLFKMLFVSFAVQIWSFRSCFHFSETRKLFDKLWLVSFVSRKSSGTVWMQTIFKPNKKSPSNWRCFKCRWRVLNKFYPFISGKTCLTRAEIHQTF